MNLPSDYEIKISSQYLQQTFSQKQFFQLKCQNSALKLLQQNKPIPSDLLKNIHCPQQNGWEVEKDRIIQRVQKWYRELTDEEKRWIKMAQYKGYKQDLPTLQLDQRTQSLDTLIACKNLDAQSRLKLECEQKLLNCKEIWLKQYSDLLEKQAKPQKPFSLFNHQIIDPSNYQTDNKIVPQDQILEDTQEQLNQTEYEKLNQQNAFWEALAQHQSDFLDFHRKKQKYCKKRAIHAKNFLEFLEKRGTEEQDKQQKERMKALKEQDFSSYVDLIKETKNTRILELLTATDSYLKQIGAKILVQKGERTSEQDQEFQTDNNDYSYLKESNKIYYNLTHTKAELISTQPGLLVGGQLKSYQIQGLEWLVSLYNNKLNGVLADEMGLGKTIQTISLFCYLMETKKNYGPFLIVVPLTTMSNWCLEFQRWAPSVKVITYAGSPQNRKNMAYQLRNTKWNVCLTTYEYILKDRHLLQKFQWKYIVVDEGHRMKNSKSKFTYTLGTQYQSEYRVLLTGTPLQNNLSELWSLLNFLLPKVFANCDDFEKWFSIPLNRVGGQQEDEGQLTEEESLIIINRLHQVLRPFLLRRVKKDVESELPNKKEFIIKVQLSAWQRIAYNQIKDNGFLGSDGADRFQTKALLNIMMQLRKICNHPYLFLNSDEYHPVSDEIFSCSGKFELLNRMIPKLIAAKHRILIFSQMTQLMDLLELYFEYKSFNYLRLDGNTKSDDRGERMADFNKPNSIYDIFLLSTRAGGLGLNLQTADTVIIFDSDWNPQMDLQAQDRAHRIGQKNEVRIYRLITNTVIEEEIFNRAAFKMGLDKLIIQAGLFNKQSTEQDRKERLENMIKNKSYQDELENALLTPEQLNDILARNEQELAFYNHFDIEHKGTGLMEDHEVPEWVTADPEGDKIENQKNYGRGNRVKKNVVYNEDLVTDEQWIHNMEIQFDNDESSQSDNKKRKARGFQDKTRKKVKEDSEFSDQVSSSEQEIEIDPEEESSEEIFEDD